MKTGKFKGMYGHQFWFYSCFKLALLELDSHGFILDTQNKDLEVGT